MMDTPRARVLADARLTPAAKLAWLVLADMPEGERTVRRLAAAMGEPRSVAHRAVSLLRDAGHLGCPASGTGGVPPAGQQVSRERDSVPPAGQEASRQRDTAPPRARAKEVPLLTGGSEAERKGDAGGKGAKPPLTPPSKPASPQRVKPHPIPPDWEPSDGTRLYAAQHCPGVDVERELCRFRAWFGEKGMSRPGWDRSFMAWLDRAKGEVRAAGPRAAAPDGARAASPGPATPSGQRLMQLLDTIRTTKEAAHG